jgi:hypothetical protein
LLKPDSWGNIRSQNQGKSTVGSERETAMHGFGKSSICMAAGFALVGGLVLLQPTAASAQINIEGLIRGALQQGCCYGGGYGGGGGGNYRYRSSGSGAARHVKSHQNDDSASAPVDKTKEKDATQVETPNNNIARQQPSAPPPSQPDPSTKQTSAARSNDDQPAFAPSR